MMTDTESSGVEHRELCDGKVKPQYDRDSGRHVVGWKCRECKRRFGRDDRVRDGVTFRYIVTETDRGDGDE